MHGLPYICIHVHMVTIICSFHAFIISLWCNVSVFTLTNLSFVTSPYDVDIFCQIKSKHQLMVYAYGALYAFSFIICMHLDLSLMSLVCI